jgi:hypothetical protein
VHEGVAKFIEMSNPVETDLRQFYVALAFHYSLSGSSRIKETFYYTMKAAEFAVENSSMTRAITYVQQALAILQQNSPLSPTQPSSPGNSRPVPIFPPNAYADNIESVMHIIDDGLKILNPGGVITQAVRMVRSTVSGDFTKAQITQSFFATKDLAEAMLRNHNIQRGIQESKSVGKTMVRGISRGLSSATLAAQENSIKKKKSSKYFGEQSIDKNLDMAAKNAAMSTKNVKKPVIAVPDSDQHSQIETTPVSSKQQGYQADEPSMSGVSLRKKLHEAEVAEQAVDKKGCTIM